MNDEQSKGLQPSTVKLDGLVSAFEKLRSINSSEFKALRIKRTNGALIGLLQDQLLHLQV